MRNKARVLARGAKIPKAEQVCRIVTSNSGIVISDSKKSKRKLDNRVSRWSYVYEIQITLVKAERS